jgi:hypothetical protein
VKFAGVAGVIALLCALVPGTAFAETTSEFDVIAFSTGLGRVAETEVDFYFPVTIPAPAKIVISVPAGYGIQPASVGTTIATVDADAQIGAQTSQLKGTVVVDDPARWASSACAPGQHTAVWTMVLPVAGETYSIPLFVDGSPSAGYIIRTCLQSPDLPPAAGGTPAGARLTYLGLDFEKTFENPARADFHRWSALVTPFAGGTATADPAAVYELRSIVPLPEQLTIKARYDAKAKSSVISGKLVTVGRPEAGTAVEIYGRPTIVGSFKKIGTATTDKHGAYSLRKRLAGSMWITPFVGVYAGKCDAAAPSLAPAGCKLQSFSPVFGDVVHATAPKAKPSAAPTKKRH